jgi:hypothetical protein
LDERGRYVSIATIDMKSWPPLRLGVPLKTPQEKYIESMKTENNLQPTTQPQTNDSFSMRDFLMLMQKQRKDDLAMFELATARAAPPRQQTSMSEMMSLFRMFTEMKNVLASDTPTDDPMASIERIMGMWNSTQNARRSEPRPLKLVDSADGKNQPTSSPPPNDKQLAKLLAEQDPRSAAESVIGALGLMDPERQTQTVNEILGLYNEFSEEDEPDDEPDDEPESDTERGYTA